MADCQINNQSIKSSQESWNPTDFPKDSESCQRISFVSDPRLIYLHACLSIASNNNY